jgi:hypothetical protein
MDTPKQILYKELRKLGVKAERKKSEYERAVKDWKELNAKIVSMEDKEEIIETDETNST